MRSCRSLLIFIPLTIVACVSEPYPFLRGQWGGGGVSLDARGTEVKFQFGCFEAIAPELSVDAAGHFEGTALIIDGGFAAEFATSLNVSGDVAGDRMAMAVTYLHPGYPSSSPKLYVLRLAAPPVWGGSCLK